MTGNTWLPSGLARAYGYEVHPAGPFSDGRVAGFWVDWHERPDRARTRRIVPDGCAHVVYWEDDTGGRLRYVGPRSTFTDSDQSRRTFTLIARLRPGAGAPILDRTVPLARLWGPSARTLSRRLADATSVTARVALLDAALARRFAAAPAADRVVDEACRGLERGDVPLARLAAAAGLSDRRWRSRIKAAVGVTPKRLARIARLHRAIGLAAAGDGASWAAIAAGAGFADQPHLGHEFQALLGETPTGFRRRF